jgi:hypothetical protein
MDLELPPQAPVLYASWTRFGEAVAPGVALWRRCVLMKQAHDILAPALQGPDPEVVLHAQAIRSYISGLREMVEAMPEEVVEQIMRQLHRHLQRAENA